MYRNAVFWFTGLLVVLVAGFWPSYFSRLGGDVSFGQHFHGVSMLLWVLMLIAQAWFIRSKKRNVHRAVGKASLVLAPLVVWSALYVVLDDIVKQREPFTQFGLSIFWFGIFLAFLFALVYALAIYYRKDMQLHARYMASTALVFMVPGLARLLSRLGETLGIWMPNFIQTMWIPGIIGLILIFNEWRKGRVRTPWVLVTALWGVCLLGFMNLYKYEWWTSFAYWYRGFG